jgi:hypothetical protein
MEKQYIKNEVKIQLWRLGKRVRDMAIIPGIKYDLLVEDKIRVAIGDEKVQCKDCDILATMMDGKLRYAKRKDMEWKRPTEIFGPKG